MKQKIDIYHLLIGIIYLIVSWIKYSQWGLLITLFFILLALSLIITSIFQEIRLLNFKNSKLAGKLNRKPENEGSKFILFCYLFVMLSFTFPFTVSIYRRDITEAIFFFLMAIILFILYLKEIKSIRKKKKN